MKKFKLFLILNLIAILTLLSSCTITANDKSVSAINGLTEKGVITSCFLISVDLGMFKKGEGSGVVFYKEENAKTGEYTYYLLTNNHVVEGFYSISVIDCYGYVYKANHVCGDSSYDLAVLTFNSANDYYVASIENNEFELNLDVISVGCPLGQINAVTLGNIVDQVKVSVKGSAGGASNVEFEVYMHTAFVDEGSSGGALFDYNYNIVGINFATSKDENNNFENGFAVPSLQVLGFLKINRLKYNEV